MQMGQELLAGLKGKGLDLGPSPRKKWVDTGRRFSADSDISAKPKSSVSEPILEQRVTKSTQTFSVVSEEADDGPVEANLAVVMEEGEILDIEETENVNECNPTSVDEELTSPMGQKRRQPCRRPRATRCHCRRSRARR
ncbi:hypothetical protein I3760_05G063300 [Carya illinoinensis]|nr:hypothetical protein I3760_05G063300 [Carya illinoinensis]